MKKFTVTFEAKKPNQNSKVQFTQTVEADSENVAIELAKTKAIKHSPLHKDYLFSVLKIK